jgi:LysR family transcriptional regulator, transcriptional activator of the cysJI operon
VRIEDLQVLRVVAAAGGVSEAARVLGRSQPGVSRSVQRLESALGTPLLDRGPKGSHLTPAGEQALDFAVTVLERYASLRQALTADQPPTPVIRVAASTVPGELLVPRLVSRFVDAHPGVHVPVTIGDSHSVIRAVLERSAEVGFVGVHDDDERLTSVPLVHDEVVLAVPAGHPLAGTPTVQVDQLAGERLLTREAGSGTQATFARALREAGVTGDLGGQLISLGSTQAVLAAAAAGLGIGVVSRLAVDAAPRAGVVPVRIQGLRIRRRLWLVYETARTRPPSHVRFIALATSQAQQLLRA